MYQGVFVIACSVSRNSVLDFPAARDSLSTNAPQPRADGCNRRADVTKPEVPSRAGRLEDHRLMTGRGAFVTDHRRPGLAHACFARSMVACGRIVALEVAKARSLAGVIDVFTAADLDADGIPDLLTEIDPPRDDGGSAIRTPRALLAHGMVRHLGEPLAIIVAETPALAADAAALVGIEIASCPVVVGQEDALAPGAPPVWLE